MNAEIMIGGSTITMLIVTLLKYSDANELSCKSDKLRESNERKDGVDKSYLGSSFSSLDSWFQKISNPSFECNKEEVDTFSGMPI